MDSPLDDRPTVVAVSRSAAHTMTKPNVEAITLIAGLGVADDAHCGATVKHRSRVAKDPTQPNLRQVHLIHVELHAELRHRGFDVAPGRMGENITTRGVDLLALPTGTKLRLGASAVVEVTGLRTPCGQLDGIQPGLRRANIETDTDPESGAEVITERRAGVMAVVLAGGEVRAGDAIAIELPAEPYQPLVPV